MLAIHPVVQGSGSRTVMVVGDIHGNERAGRAVVRQLRRLSPIQGVKVVTVATANPHGEAANTRQNEHGVDLNRNFPNRWKPGPRGTFYPGPKPASEPETRTMMRIVRRYKPDVTIWYHQHLSLVTLLPGADNAIVRAYGRRVGLPARRLTYRGTATGWQNRTFKHDTAFVVELPAGPLSKASAKRHARAALATVAPPANQASAPKPHIVKSFIPFPDKRKREMRRYSKRHYGVAAYKLKEVKTIVEHFTAINSYSATYNTFANDVPDSELHELPATCAHFVIDTDGTIHQLVPLTLRCRHTVGLNDRSIGIEHVATSDAWFADNRRMRRASLKLTRWLQAKYDVPTKYVIGHAESLSSPFHHELVPSLKHQTHADMQPATMRRYRKAL